MQPSNKAPLIAHMLETLGGRTTAITTNHCVPKPIGCGKPIGPFKDELSRKEYTISGLCQNCQDEILTSDN